MGFYEELMAYYEDVFPLAPMKLHWLKALIDDLGAENLLDIGCATGDLCGALTYTLTAVDGFDLDEAMIDKAKGKFSGSNLRFRVGNMLALDQVFPGVSYDVITCFGNTFVHVPQDKLTDIFSRIHKTLNDGGVFIGQILNYEHVLDAPIKALPLIDNERVTFERFYDGASEEEVDFRTILTVKEGDKRYKNTIQLYPIRRESLSRKLNEAGFTHLRFYKNYKGEEAGGPHLPLIFVAVK